MGKTPEDRPTTPLNGLNPLGLMDGVLGGQATDWEPPQAHEIELLFPGYLDFEFIDRGGMGAVYAATQKSLERRVAIKILPPEMGQDAAFLDRFHQEARLLARLQHPHIVAIYDFGRNGLGHLFIVMEYVEGTSLLEVMKREKLPLRRVLEVTEQVCDALQFAHDHGVIHRDIKPTNILIDVRGCVRVADFGLAKQAVVSAQVTTHSNSGMVMGTPGYAAPEQRRVAADLDHRADIFSLGVTLYEMLTGHLPVGVFEPPSKKSEAPAFLDKVVIKALRERPADRFQRASEMRDAILNAAERMGSPLMQRTIAKRPIVSMMTSVIVGAGFIYLLDTLNTELLEKPQPVTVMSYVDSEHGPTVLRLNEHFSVVRLRLTWEEAHRRVRVTPGLTLASFHSAEEVREVTEKLLAQNITAPVWTGGRPGAEEGKFTWDDGTAFDFAAWMPAAQDPPVVITEIQAKNQKMLRSEDGESPDWIEIHNPGTTPADLTGWHLRHLSGRYAFEGRLGASKGEVSPDQMVIQPGEFRVIYCQDSGPHAGGKAAFGFQLEAQSGRIRWGDPRGNLVQNMESEWTRFPADASLIWNEELKTWGWSARATPGQPNAEITKVFLPPPTTPAAAPSTSAQAARAILMLPDFDGRWTLDTQKRTAWCLVRHSVKPAKRGGR